MAAGRYNFTIEQGATFNRQFTYKDADGDGISLTGFTIRMMAKRKLEDDAEDALIDANTDNEKIILDDETDGVFYLNLSASETQLLPTTQLIYDVEIESPVGTVDRILQGFITITPGVTQ